jgi:TonB family protein
MSRLWWWALLGCLVAAGPVPAPGAPGPGGDFYGRIRANDAPIAGRISIYAYALDSLDAAVSMPGPGRVLAVNFREANGKDSFLIPGDLALTGARKQTWNLGFIPLGPERIDGLMTRDDSRWALWWIPLGDTTLVWESPLDLQITYGFARSRFVPLEAKDAAATLRALPWADIAATSIPADRPTAELRFPPDPAAFDQAPIARERKDPSYPLTSRMYDFEGMVHVVAVVSDSGTVSDAYVLHSDAVHQLNVAALVAVSDWIFRPGKKNGKAVSGEMVIPIRFGRGESR